MAFKLVVEPEAQKEIDKAFDYYKSVTDDINIINLYNDIENAYNALKANPFFQVRSKHYRALPLKKYPYLIFFEVHEKKRIVKILSFLMPHKTIKSGLHKHQANRRTEFLITKF